MVGVVVVEVCPRVLVVELVVVDVNTVVVAAAAVVVVVDGPVET